MSEQFVAGAFVDVQAETKGFKADLIKKLDSEISKLPPRPIPIEIDVKGLKTKLDNALKNLVKVQVDPKINRGEFRKSVNEQATKALDGLKITVPVDAAARPATGAAAGAGAGAAGAGGAVTPGVVDQTTKSTKKLTEAQERRLAVNKALAASDEQVRLGQGLLAQSTQSHLSVQEQSTRLKEAGVAADQAVKSANDQLILSQGKLTDEQERGLKAKLDEATVLRQSVNDRKKEVETENAVAASRNSARAARRDALIEVRKEVKGIGDLNELKKVENALTSVEARLERESAAARKLGLTSVVNANQARLNQIETQKQAILLQRKSLKDEATGSRRQATAARGFGSSLLSLLNIRGATLAANSAFLAGAAGAALFAKSLQSFAAFEEELNVFQATAHASAEEMKQVAALARQLGQDVRLPGVSAADAAQAMNELARAGLSVRDSMDGARGVLQLAAAAQISNAEAANIAASTLNAFGLAGEKATHVADLLAAAANASQGTIVEMAAALQQSEAVARQVGLTVEDTVAILALFARNGLKGSDAGTSFRTAMSRLIAPTTKATQLIDKLNLNLRDSEGSLRADVFAQFGEATKNLTPELRDMIAQTIAGQDAIRAFSIGAREGTRGLELMRLETQRDGAAAELAAARSKGLSGSFRALGSTAETLGTSLGKLAAGPTKLLVGGLNELLTTLNLLASGDFSGLGDDLGEDLVQIGKNAKVMGKGFLDLAEGIGSLDPGKALRGLRGIAVETEDNEDPGKKVDELREKMAALNQIRVQKFELRLPTQGVDEDIKKVMAQLRGAKVDAGEIVPLTEIEKAFKQVNDALKGALHAKTELEIDTPANRRTIQQLRERLDKAGKIKLDLADLRKEQRRLKLAGLDTTAVDRDVKNMRKRLIATLLGTKVDIEKAVTGIEIAKTFKTEFDLFAQMPELATPEVISGLERLATKIKTVAPLTGEAGQALGRSLIESINAAMAAAAEEDNPELVAQFKAFAEKIAALFGIELKAAFKNMKAPITETEIADALLPEQIRTAKADAFGSIADQISAREAELADLNKQLKKVVEGSKEQKSVLDQITGKKNEIRSLREKQASDEKDANQKSDQKVIDALGADERKRQNALVVAQGTESLKDDLKRELALRDLYLKQIDQVGATVKDADERKKQLSDLNQKLFDINQDINRDKVARREQIREDRMESLDEGAEAASETETLADDQNWANRKVAAWKREVDIIKKLVKDGKASKDELDKALDDLDEAEDARRGVKKERQQQIKDLKAERLELRIQIAADEGNVNAEVAAREAQIANTKKLMQATKAGSIARLRLQAQLKSEQKELNDLKNQAKEGEKGTTVFELLSEFAQAFPGGNLITGNQPFAGPAGFVGDISTFLTRAQGLRAGTPVPPPKPPGPAKDDLFSRNDQAKFQMLANAIEANTAAITGKTPGTVGPPKVTVGDRINESLRYATAVQARRVREGLSGI